MTLIADAEDPLYLVEHDPHDCGNMGILQQITVGDCAEGTMTLAGYEPGDIIWLIGLPTVFMPPDGVGPEEYDYVIWFSGLMSAVPAVSTTWSTVKSLFR